MPLQILVPLHTYLDGNSPNLASHVGAAASHLGGEAYLLTMHADFPSFHSPLADVILDVPAMVQFAKMRCQENAAVLIRAIRSELEQRGVKMHSLEADYLPTELANIVIDSCKYHDLSILGVGRHDAALCGTAEAAIFGSGKPVLLVPEDLPAACYDHVAIAWDGSRVAARAVADAWPFLLRATSISILCVDDEKPLPENNITARLAEYLSHHGLKAHGYVIQTRAQPIAETLQDHSLSIGAGLLVMGGYGHSRIRDFVLGGATGGILRALKLPALLSH